MAAKEKFGILRRVLRGLGLSKKSTNEAVDFIGNLLTGEQEDFSSANGTSEQIYPYKLRDHFLSPAELNFYRVLRDVIQENATICTKVSLRDVFYVSPRDASLHRTYLNKIDRKHVDFLLCDNNTMQPIVGIELDDSSHQRKDRQERDQFVDAVFQAAGLPILHFPVHRAYAIQEIKFKLAPHLGGNISITSEEVDELIDSPASIEPMCPKCGGKMLLRTAKKGANAGRQFWGCENYPKCRAMMPFENSKQTS